MWFEIIPSFAIIVGVLSVPGYAIYYINKGAFGTPYKRSILNFIDREYYLRDYRVSGDAKDAYVHKGLEAIPDQ